jgi:hypothetical protein
MAEVVTTGDIRLVTANHVTREDAIDHQVCVDGLSGMP